MRTRTMGRGLIVAACLSLAACGGGGDEDGFGNGGPIEPGSGGPIGGGPPGSGGGGGGGPDGTVSLAPGIWIGSSVVDGSGQARYMEALVTEEGDFYMTTEFSDTEIMDFLGDDDGEDTEFDADNVNTYSNFAPRPDSSIQGTVDPGFTFEGSINSGNTSATFQLSYTDLYERTASLAKLQGVYSFSDGGASVSIVVELDGDLTATLSNGCTLTGDVTAPNPDRNYYRIDGTISGCGVDNGPMSGLIYLADSSAVDQDDVLILVGETDAESTSVYVAGIR